MSSGDRLVVLLAFVLLGGLPSCIGSNSTIPLEQVSGRITLDGESLEGASVVFESAESGDSVHGSSDSQGRYELMFDQRTKGAPAGKYVVRIIKPEAEVAGQEMIPASYNTESTLTAEVRPGKNEFDFEVTSK